MANQKIVNELNAPAAHGIDGITVMYTNPGGAARDESLAIVEANAALMNQKNIDVYKATIEGGELFGVLTSASLVGLSSTERADYSAFIVPMLTTNISNPAGLLKDLINTIFSNNTDDVAVRADYEALIREQKSVAQILGVSVRAGDVEQAMLELGWIV